MKYEFIKNAQMIYAANLVNVKDHKNYFKYLRIENNEITATNGKALINFTLDIDIENGYYEVIKKTKSITHILKVKELNDFVYPAFQFLLNPSGHEDMQMLDLKSYQTIDTGLSSFIFDFAKNGIKTINIKYLDCIDCLGVDFICYKHETRPYIIKSGSMTIVIMGIWRE